MSDKRLVIAFAEPPDELGFTRAKSGKCWFRQVDSLQWARNLAAQLVNLEIHGVIKKPAKNNRGTHTWAAATPQHRAASNLPLPINPPAPKRVARSIDEEREIICGAAYPYPEALREAQHLGKPARE